MPSFDGLMRRSLLLTGNAPVSEGVILRAQAPQPQPDIAHGMMQN